MHLLDLLFPKKCIGCKALGGYLCTTCFARIEYSIAPVCGICGKGSMDGRTHPICQGKYTLDGIISGVVYQGVVKKMVYQFKFQPYLTDLQHIMAQLLYEALIQNETFTKIKKNDCLLIPIPLHAKRLRTRGYNQSMLLGRQLQRLFNLSLSDALLRTKATHTQVGLTHVQRRENMKEVFALKTTAQVKDMTVLLVDDVVTSGSTLNEAAKVLKRAGAKEVWGITFAHGQ